MNNMILLTVVVALLVALGLNALEGLDMVVLNQGACCWPNDVQ